MNPDTHAEVLRETDQLQKYRDNSSIDTVLQERCPSEQTPPRNPVTLYVPDRRDVENFVGGAGI